MNDTISLLKNHRSIRSFRDQPVSDEIVESLIEAATSASTSSNIQATTVIRVSNPETRAAFAELAGGQSQITKCGIFWFGALTCTAAHSPVKWEAGHSTQG